MATTIQIISDIHLEQPKGYDIFEILPKAPYLALLGDIGKSTHEEEFLQFLLRQLQQFRIVFFVPGNHEAYGSTWPATIESFRAFEQDVMSRRESDPELGQFIFLERDVFKIHTKDECIAVLGCSLFSHVPPEQAMTVELRLNDFFSTKDWDVRAHNEAHKRDLAWLNDKVQELERDEGDVKIVILSHWSPTTDPRSTDPKHVGSPISTAFSTDLSTQPCFTSEKVVLWAFGHLHYNCDFHMERKNAPPLRLMTNQRGYYFAQAPGYGGEKVVEL